MCEHEDHGAWLAGRRSVESPPGFADRVMARLEEESSATSRHRPGVVEATWFHVVACAAASVVLILRLGCAYSLFIVF